MELRPYRAVIRKKTKQIKVGNVSVGGDSPISVQSMTNTLTTDAKSTINQINSLEEKELILLEFLAQIKSLLTH